jgi:nitroreductase/NAD-dependent dihydropyrimidine dehydrogenase PreA subunit
MSWVEIDQESCTNCRLCLNRCPRCFSRTGDRITVAADALCCNLCGHCVALCPTGAITHHRMDMDNFPEIGPAAQIDTGEFLRMIRQRRSQRVFLKKPVPKEVLDTLVEAVRYCPTGSNVQGVGLVILQNPDRIRTLSNLTVDFFEASRGAMEAEIQKVRDQGGKPDDYTLRMLEIGKRAVEARAAGIDPIFHRAPIVMIFHSVVPTSTPKDNCMIAAQTVVLTAMTLGLGTCYIGLFEMAANIFPPLIRELDLPPSHQVLSVLILGWPKVKYQRVVDRLPVAVRWG